MSTHLESELHSRLPVCDDAGVDPTDLTADTAKVTCWECRSIADIPEPPVDYGTTWDGVRITPDLIVFTNEMRVGKVVAGSVREHNPGWFDVQYRTGAKVMQSPDRVATHFNGASATRTYRTGHDWVFPGGERQCSLCGVTEKNNDPCPQAPDNTIEAQKGAA